MKEPNVHVIVRSLSIYSEVWLQRQLRYPLFNRIICTAQPKSKDAEWGNKVVYLSNPNSLLFRTFSKLGQISHQQIQKRKNRRLKSLLQKGDVLIIHYMEVATGLMDVIKTGDYQVFIYCHGYGMFDDLRLHDNPQKRYHAADYLEHIHLLSDHASFITNSSYSLKRLSGMGIPLHKIHLNYYGLPTDAESTEPATGHFKVLYVGRLVDFKGPDLTIKAFEGAMKMGLHGDLTIIGDGPLRVTIELMRQRSPYKKHIHILGSKSAAEVRNEMLRSHVFTAHNCEGVLTKQEEAFGVTIIEAMNVGLPIVATRSGGVVDSVAHNETGILIDPLDIQSHSEALFRLSVDNDLWASFSKAAKVRVQEKFSKEMEIKNLRKIIQRQ